MPQPPASAIGNLADLQDGQIALSRFIVQRPDGLYVNPARLDDASDLLQFVDRVFECGLYFRALDYAQFAALLYGDPLPGITRGKGAGEEVFLAVDITAFRRERQALYKDLRIERGEAAYLFEPVFLESSDRPAIADSGGEQRLETRVHLDVDEFIASAWAKGVRYGLDVAAVQEAIEHDKAERRVVARSKPCVPGKDAEIEELAPGLRRNNAPRHLMGTRVDLAQFETRYPQVTTGMRLVRKTPRVAGVDGRDVSGELRPAPLPKDFDMETLAGPGTRVSREKDGEFLVAAVNGFLNIDTASNSFSVTDKIVSHEGVSARTTGDLFLTGEEYEQHGEIQEKRIVKCRSITAYADVFGKILSAGGLVRLKQNLVGGSASNDDGDIVVEGVASGATLIALQGRITVNRAENCIILGREVVIANATYCDVVADALMVEVASACALAGKSLQLRLARARKEADNALLVLLPDLSSYETRIAGLQQKHAALAKVIAGHREKIDALRSEKEVSSYLVLAGKLRRHEATLSPEQQVGWRRLTALVAPVLRTLSQLGDVLNEMDGDAKALAAQLEELLAAREKACTGVGCTVDAIDGDTRVSTLLVRLADTPLSALPNKELKARLRRTDGATRLLFSGTQGNFTWAYRTPPP